MDRTLMEKAIFVLKLSFKMYDDFIYFFNNYWETYIIKQKLNIF